MNKPKILHPKETNSSPSSIKWPIPFKILCSKPKKNSNN